MKFEPGQHIHLVGIGGSGMSAIARVLLEQGYTVSGSDRGSNELIDALARDGATIYKGHDASYIAGADILIITSAVKDDHMEVVAARAAGLPVYKRQDVMAALMEGKKVIAVAGTKGKTTTASMIVHILRECGQDPSYIVGGILGNTGTNAGVGQGEWFVVEADEYDNMFLGLRPDIAVITNIEWDHPDFFKTPEEMVEAFRQFVGLLPEDGILLGCGDDPSTLSIVLESREKGHEHSFVYGLNHPQQIWQVPIGPKDVVVESNGSMSFDFKVMFGRDLPRIKINLSGIHNVLNAVAAVAAVMMSAVNDIICIYDALSTFKPTARRFDLRADVGGIAVIDDYAHNPMSIRATLDAARQRYPDRELWAVWQPHTYSRAQALFGEFVTAFDAADHVLTTDIYAARENPIPGVNSAGIVKAINQRAQADSPSLRSGEGVRGRGFARYTPGFVDVVNVLRAEVKAPAVILIMSAGDAPQIGVDYLKALEGEG